MPNKHIKRFEKKITNQPLKLSGSYKGKIISEKEYKKLESADKESGYAWRAVSQDGDVIYLDGASHRASNWLRFVNCARGRCEENVLVRNVPGMIWFYYISCEL